MPQARRSIPAPYNIDTAVTDEQEFWRHIRELIAEAVEQAVVKHGLPEATAAMKAVVRTQKTLIQRVNDVGAQQASLVSSYDRLAAWCTVKGAEDDLLKMKLDKFFDLVTPPSSKPTPP